MAWVNRQQYTPSMNPSLSGDQAMAVDWEVKKIPGLCYKASILTKELLIMSRGGIDDARKAFIRFVAAVESFYSSVDTEFNKYMKSPKYLTDETLPKKKNMKLYEQKDYVKLAMINWDYNQDNYEEVVHMFTILRLWCFTQGPFRVYNDVEMDDEDVFKRLERELA